MRVRIRPEFVVAVFATLFVSGLATRLNAEARCTNASLHGSYAFQVDGMTATGIPFAAVGRNFYNGQGFMRGTIVVSVGGQTFGPYPYGYSDASYTVNSDCTGRKSVTLPVFGTVSFWFAIDDNLREVRMIAVPNTPPSPSWEGTAASVTVSGTARKVFTDEKSKDRD